MKLKDCKHGVLVSDRDNRRIGMIVGITNSADCGTYDQRVDPENAIPLVQWSVGNTTGIHQGNIKPYKGNL